MEQKTPFAAKIAFRLPTSLYVKLNAWAAAEDRPLANLIYTIVKQAVVEREIAHLPPCFKEEGVQE